MLRNIPAWQKNTLRLLAWSCAALAVWAICQDSAFAQGSIGAAVEEDAEGGGFFGPVLRSIFTFDTKGLMVALSNPKFKWAAFAVLNVIVFVETGLLVGFFLPGDSLLVITGLICSYPACGWDMSLLLVSLSISAIVGDTVGYWIGYSTGPKIFNREKSFFFNKDHLLKAQQFYEKHGGITIVLARFMPILRTFAPVVAGVGKMEYRSFLFYNVIGGVSWVVSMVLAGRYLPELLNPPLQRLFDNPNFLVQEHVEKVVIIVVFLSISPAIIGWLKSKLSNRPAAPAPANKEVALSAK